ncbi:MAG: caspase family protein, partial [Thermoanaerobaculia bacterium]|nr:caspase family protein [Thermoanaerobaculia bacterium]
MRQLFFSLLFLIAAALPAQEPVPNTSGKGAAPLNPQSVIRPVTSGQSTRAVIVGISDYQSPHIPDLRFAHRDAEAFAEWLRSPAGGSVPADNVQIFTDKKATNAAVITALDALLDVCQPGDQVVFYFSGHGDVETKTRSNPGFLLTHDTPPNVYMAGAINLRDLLDIVGTLSDKQVKVILITDACHAGKLAGSNAGGTHATAYSLQQQFANEVKIMSCQPNEFSLEGEEWGGGRGVFSYHLIDALTGLADKNEDDMVNLLEAGRYLEETVPAATAPHPQMPVTSGDRLTTLARVDAASLAALKQSKTGSTTLLSSTGSKGLEDEVLARADSLTRARYHAFKMALDGNKLLENNDSCADAHFRYLIGQEVLSPLYGLMRRNFAVALLDEVQQSLNAILEADPTEVNTWKFKPDKYTLYPAYLDRAIELVGQRHFLHKTLMAKKLFFEAYLANFYAVGFNTKLASDSLKKDIQRKLHRAMGYDSTAAYLYYLMGNTFQSSFRIDSLDHYYRQANSLSPGWMLPATELAFIYINHYPNHRKAREILESAVANHPRSYVGLEMLAWVYQRFNLMDSIESVCARMRAIQPAAPNDLATLGYSHLFITRNYPKAELYFKKALEVDSSVAWHVKYGLAELHFLSRNPAQGQKWLQAVPAELRRFFDPTELILHRYYIRSGRYREADSVLMVLRS